MDCETLQKKYDRLLDLTRKTRGHQKEFFKYRASVDKDKARYWERQLDDFIKTELKEREQKQQDLF